jgi:hypothetical protein
MELTMKPRQSATTTKALPYRARYESCGQGRDSGRTAQVGCDGGLVAHEYSTAVEATDQRKYLVSAVKRRPRPRTYGYDALKMFQWVWFLLGEPCGKYLTPIRSETQAQLESSGELELAAVRLADHVRIQLVPMNPATIDRLLKPASQWSLSACELRNHPEVDAALLDFDPPNDRWDGACTRYLSNRLGCQLRSFA